MALKVRAVSSLDDLADVADGWADLVRATGASPFTHPMWCLPWLRHLAPGPPFVLVATEGTDVVGVAPLHERRMGGITLVRFLGHGLGAVSSFVVAPGRDDVAVELWQAALGRRRFAELLEYRADGPGLPELGRLPAAHQRVTPRDQCPVIDLRPGAEAWWEASNRELRRVLRRADRALAEAGATFDVELVRDAARAAEVLPELVAVHDAAEEANPRQHLLAGSYAPFSEDLLATAAAADRLRLLVGRVDGRPASFMVLLESGGTAALWLNRFDPSFVRFSPGHVVLRAAVDVGFEEGWDALDLLIGVPRYKKLWAETTYDTLTVVAASSGAVLGAGRMALAVVNLRRTVPARAASAVPGL